MVKHFVRLTIIRPSKKSINPLPLLSTFYIDAEGVKNKVDHGGIRNRVVKKETIAAKQFVWCSNDSDVWCINVSDVYRLKQEDLT